MHITRLCIDTNKSANTHNYECPQFYQNIRPMKCGKSHVKSQHRLLLTRLKAPHRPRTGKAAWIFRKGAAKKAHYIYIFVGFFYFFGIFWYIGPGDINRSGNKALAGSCPVTNGRCSHRHVVASRVSPQIPFSTFGKKKTALHSAFRPYYFNESGYTFFYKTGQGCKIKFLLWEIYQNENKNNCIRFTI